MFGSRLLAVSGAVLLAAAPGVASAASTSHAKLWHKQGEHRRLRADDRAKGGALQREGRAGTTAHELQ